MLKDQGESHEEHEESVVEEELQIAWRKWKTQGVGDEEVAISGHSPSARLSEFHMLDQGRWHQHDSQKISIH